MEFSANNEAVDIRLAVPAQVRAGELVPIRIVIHNPHEHAIGLATTGPNISFDILISHGGKLVWQRLAGQVIALVLEIRMLQPGETFELTEVWRADVKPGVYDIVARIPTDGDPLLTRGVRLEIRAD